MTYYPRFFGVIFSLLLVGCSVSRPISVEQTSPKTRLDADVAKTSASMHHYLLGQLSMKKDDLPTAIKNLDEASKLASEPSAQLNGALAELQLRSGNLEKALEESSKALEASPQDGHLLALHAGILDALGRTEEAIGHYKKSIAAAPDKAEPALLLSAVLSRTDRAPEAIVLLEQFLQQHSSEVIVHFYLGRAFEQTGDLARAAKHIKMTVDAQGNNSALALEYVRVLLKQRRLQEAKQTCSDIIKKDPENALARKVMAQLLVSENRYDEALEHFSVLEKLDTESTDAQLNIAIIHLERKNYDEAIKQLNLVLAKDASNSDAQYALANAYAGKNNLKQAAETLTEIGTDDRNFERARTYAAFLYREAGMLAEAADSLVDVIEEGKADNALIMYLAELYKEQGKTDKAREVIRDLLEQDSQNDKLWYEYAMLSFMLHDGDEVHEAIEKALSINPKNPEALNFLAYDLAVSGTDLERALSLAKEAVALKPNDGYVLDTLGWVYYKMGNVAEAVAALKRAVSIVNDDPVVLEHYGDVLLASGNRDEAKSVYDSINPAKARDDESKEAVERVKKKLAAW